MYGIHEVFLGRIFIGFSMAETTIGSWLDVVDFNVKKDMAAVDVATIKSDSVGGLAHFFMAKSVTNLMCKCTEIGEKLSYWYFSMKSYMYAQWT